MLSIKRLPAYLLFTFLIMIKALTKIALKEIKPTYKGKVRDIYDLGDELLLVATDRLSAFDVVFDKGIPEKGKILTSISSHWFGFLKGIEHHMITDDVNKFPYPFHKYANTLSGRSVLVKKTDRINFECVVRNYLMGSAYKEYVSTGKVCGIDLPKGLCLGEKLPQPIFTPATKSDTGHDINISFTELENFIGTKMAAKLRDTSIDLFLQVYNALAQENIIMMDTKLEFGLLNDRLILIDEIFTPDSSRFTYEKNLKTPAEKSIASMDKQIIRDYLEKIKWDKNPPAPTLPDSIINETRLKYLEIQEIVKCITH